MRADHALQALSVGAQVLILGAGPNRIGQGIEFDYCCCHASFALRQVADTDLMVTRRHVRPTLYMGPCCRESSRSASLSTSGNVHVPWVTRRDADFETIMLNCNPETVSTDYDTSSRLYFEPLTVEDVLNVIEKVPYANKGLIQIRSHKRAAIPCSHLLCIKLRDYLPLERATAFVAAI